MSKPRGSMDVAVRVIFVILMGVLTIFLSLLFLAVFVAVVAWYLWKANDRIAALEKKLADKEKQPEQS